MFPIIDLAKVAKWVVGILVGVSVLMLIFAMFPASPLPPGVAMAITWVVQQMVNFDWLVPMATLFAIVKLILLIEVIQYGVFAVLFVFKFFNRNPSN